MHWLLDSVKEGSRGWYCHFYTCKYQKSFTHFNIWYTNTWGLPGGSMVKNSPANGGDGGDMACEDPWIRKIPWRRAWHPLQYSCLENPMDRGSWWATVLESDMTEQLSTRTRTHTNICFSLYIALMQVKQHSAKMTPAIKSLQ